MQQVLTAIRHRLTHPVRDGRTFAAAVVVALLTLPVTTALAYWSLPATGSGTISGAQAGTAPAATVSISQNSPFVYSGPSTTSLVPGGTVQFGVLIRCTSGCPAYVGSVVLQTWSSNQPSCDPASLSGLFTMTPIGINDGTIGSGGVGVTANITFNDTSQNAAACSGAQFSFVLAAAA